MQGSTFNQSDARRVDRLRLIVIGLLLLAVTTTGAVLGATPAEQPLSQPTVLTSQLLAASDQEIAAPVVASPESTIRDVVQRANAQQVQAIATHDSSPMADTSTLSHYQELVQINNDLLAHGVTSISLVRLDWGPITVDGSTAIASVDETWLTTSRDGTTMQSRDRNLYRLVQVDGTWRIDADEHPTISSDPSAATPNGEPRPAAVAVPAGHSTSRNWSGYAATGGEYTAVSGSWIVPAPATDAAFGTDAVWVDIGGVNSRDLIQAGTNTTVSGRGQAQYQAWIEMLPRAAQPIPLAVRPGDAVSVSIARQPDTTWLISFVNDTTGQTYQDSERYTSTASSAEWVVEAPSSGRGLLPLDNFGTVGFTAGSTVKDGQSLTIAASGAHPITMIGGQNEALAIPSTLGDNGETFSVTRTDAPSTILPGRDGPSRPGGRRQ
jgi:hypothetical protein